MLFSDHKSQSVSSTTPIVKVGNGDSNPAPCVDNQKYMGSSLPSAKDRLTAGLRSHKSNPETEVNGNEDEEEDTKANGNNGNGNTSKKSKKKKKKMNKNTNTLGEQIVGLHHVHNSNRRFSSRPGLCLPNR